MEGEDAQLTHEICPIIPTNTFRARHSTCAAFRWSMLSGRPATWFMSLCKHFTGAMPHHLLGILRTWYCLIGALTWWVGGRALAGAGVRVADHRFLVIWWKQTWLMTRCATLSPRR